MRTTGLIPLLLGCTAVAGAQLGPRPRPIGAVLAISADSFAAVGGVRVLSDGRLLVNEIVQHRLHLLDATMSHSVVLADSFAGTARAYPRRGAVLVSYIGDSTLFIDASTVSMVVIDPEGKFGRVVAVPRSRDIGPLVSADAGAPGFDAAGRLVYRVIPPPLSRPVRVQGAYTLRPLSDSAPILRADVVTRRIDTAGFSKYTPIRTILHERAAVNGYTVAQEINPLRVSDEWTVMSDGAIAIVRSLDYHIDWIDSAGRLSATAKLPFPWQRLTDEAKVALIDSAKAMRARALGSSSRDASSGAPVDADASAVSPLELPDYWPPFRQGAVRADADGNLWILTTARYEGASGLVYDVVSRQGALIDRVEVPSGRSIIGFGKDGIVYVRVRAGSDRLERRRVR